MVSIEKEQTFKWKHYQPDIILLTVLWYLRYNLNFCDLVEMIKERGLSLALTTKSRKLGSSMRDRVDKRI